MAKITTITNPLTGQPAQVDQLDHTAQQIDDAIARALPGGAIDSVLSSKPNPNLLDNWYFGNPVDQRGGYVVPPGTNYYARGVVDSPSGQTDKYYVVGPLDSNSAGYYWYQLKIGSETYYVRGTDIVRGYTGAGYGIDRWLNAYNPNNFAVLITDNGLATSGSAIDGPFIMQRFERDFGGKLSGKTVTFSVLTTNGLYSGTAVFPVENTPDVHIVDNADIFMYFQWSQASANLPCAVFVMRNADIKYIAAKLELGSQQTLAHQDENGVWVLNEIPNYAEELAKCQRYFVRIRPSNNSQTVANGIIDAGLSSTWFRIGLPSQLRTLTPAISINAGGRFTAVNANTYVQTPLGINAILYGLTTNEIQLGIPVASTKFDALGYCTLVMDTNSYIDIIADL